MAPLDQSRLTRLGTQTPPHQGSAPCGLDLVVFQWNVVEGRDLSTAGSLQPQAIDALSLQDDRWTLRDVAPGVERIWLGGHTGAAPPDQIMVVAMELERSERINGIILAVLAAVLGLVLGIIVSWGLGTRSRGDASTSESYRHTSRGSKQSSTRRLHPRATCLTPPP